MGGKKVKLILRGLWTQYTKSIYDMLRFGQDFYVWIDNLELSAKGFFRKTKKTPASLFCFCCICLEMGIINSVICHPFVSLFTRNIGTSTLWLTSKV